MREGQCSDCPLTYPIRPYAGGITDPDKHGWIYCRTPPGDGGDARKLVTLLRDGMVWIGIRFWQPQFQRWVNNGEPLSGEQVLAWQDLPQPAPHRWYRGQLVGYGADGV